MRARRCWPYWARRAARRRSPPSGVPSHWSAPMCSAALPFRRGTGKSGGAPIWYDVQETARKRVAAIIVHYGDPRRTIRSVRCHYQLGIFSEIIVVANDLSARPEALASTLCTWLVPSRNIGFGGACQFGATTRLADVYAFFNAHVTMDRLSVEHCIAAFSVKDVGISAPYVYNASLGDESTNWRNAYGSRTYSRVLHLPIYVPVKTDIDMDRPIRSGLIDCTWVGGAAIFCRKEIIRDVGWDGSYFLTAEDVDISLRTRKHGWRVVNAAPAVAFHTGESTRTSTASKYYQCRNSLWLARKYYTSRVQALLTLYLLLLICRVAVADTLKRRHPRHAPAVMRGILDGWRLWPRSYEALPGEPLF